ncbi:MAG: hypothetical protein ACPG7F_18605, partial [Aggregatilineales bacterium]
ENQLPAPFMPNIPDISTMSFQNDAFFQAWELHAATTYGVNTFTGLSPMLDNFYLAGFDDIPADEQSALTDTIEQSMSLYNNGSWLPELSPAPDDNPEPFAILDTVMPLLQHAAIESPSFFMFDEKLQNAIIPTPDLPVAQPITWQLEQTLEDLLAPVPVSAALESDIARLQQLPDIIYPAITVPTVKLPVPIINPVQIDALQDIRQQQQTFVVQRFTPSITGE